MPPNKYWPDGVYCHTPDNRVVRFTRDGSTVTELARLPGDNSDGALAFDAAGALRLRAARGDRRLRLDRRRSLRGSQGRPRPAVGAYPGPGGADKSRSRRRAFGRASGLVLLSIDQDSASGRVLAIDGRAPCRSWRPARKRRQPDRGHPVRAHDAQARGPPRRASMSPTRTACRSSSPPPPAAQLAPFAGQVLVGSELEGSFWLINATASGFQVQQLATTFPGGNLNLEGAASVP